jgi:nitroreductase
MVKMRQGQSLPIFGAITFIVYSTPMEGFRPTSVYNILGLVELGLKSVALLPLGYRDSENDYLASLKKVRWDNSKFFIKK